MATHLKKTFAHDPAEVPSAKGMRFGIVVSEWNAEVTHALLEGAFNCLVSSGAREKDIVVSYVPGSFELPAAAQWLARNKSLHAVICLGCVIQGETPHFDYICQGVTQGITDLNLKLELPFIFGVLTTHDLEQAKARAGGKYGNKGEEAAVTAIKMAQLRQSI